MIAEICHIPSGGNSFVDLTYDVVKRQILWNLPIFWQILLNQVCSSFEESKSFEFDGRLDVLVVLEVP